MLNRDERIAEQVNAIIENSEGKAVLRFRTSLPAAMWRAFDFRIAGKKLPPNAGEGDV